MKFTKNQKLFLNLNLHSIQLEKHNFEQHIFYLMQYVICGNSYICQIFIHGNLFMCKKEKHYFEEIF